MIMTVGGFGTGVFLKGWEVVLEVEEVDEVGAEEAEEEEVGEEEDGELFVVVEELDGVHDELWWGHGWGLKFAWLIINELDVWCVCLF